MSIEHIRNFSIIAHIDHGKSTLADRLLEATGAITEREKQAQFLDKMELERERGITIKSQTCRLKYGAKNGKNYQLNLIDTPGHVDFSYEVSRSLAASEGAILVVDAAQGVEAQTVANVYLAVDNGLEIIPVLNKIDLPSARPAEVIAELEDGVGIEAKDALAVSAKDGTGIRELLERIVERVPHPRGDSSAPAKALIFDSWYDSYRGVVILVRVIDGQFTKGQLLRTMGTRVEAEIAELGAFTPHMTPLAALGVGEVGYVITGVKDVKLLRVGDTVTDARRPAEVAFPGFKQIQPMVYSGIFPIDSDAFEDLRDSLEKLALNDSSITFEPESSSALGFGFRCGFLGLLHMEIIQERLEREYNLELITTAPNVVYKAFTKDGEEVVVDNPNKIPVPMKLAHMEEPIVLCSIHCPSEYVGAILKLCNDRRGIQREIKYLSPTRVMIIYELPLAEIIFDFFDKLKSVSRGYGSLDYEFLTFRQDDLVRVDVLVNGNPVDALSLICHRDRAQQKGRDLVTRMKEVIPRQMYEVIIQAAIGTKVVARVTQKAFRKNVTAKCYGGDITRKRKLLEKQKEGKKRMKQVGNIEIPQEAFHAILKVE
ncbi:MAG: elongation factor 4 [Myxococcales bacterium]|nr:elongation factor 4 [Myxococcales bacterium]